MDGGKYLAHIFGKKKKEASIYIVTGLGNKYV